MSSVVHWYVISLVAGLLLVGAEIFIPGGILGFIGGLALLAAIITGFSAFGPQGGLVSAFLIILASGISVFIWMKYFPRTRVGKIFTLDDSEKEFKATDDFDQLMGKSGTALTDLRPSGIATIDGTRVDVMAEGNWINKDTPLKVIHVEGNLITVRESSA